MAFLKGSLLRGESFLRGELISQPLDLRRLTLVFKIESVRKNHSEENEVYLDSYFRLIVNYL